jgi:hypothetical protein
MPILISGIITIGYFIAYPVKLFFIGNVFYNFGLGPKLLKDSYLLGINNFPKINTDFVKLFSSIGLILLFILLVLLLNTFTELIKNRSKTERSAKETFLYFSFLLLIFYSGFLFISVSFFDRYLIIPLMLILAILVASYGDGITSKRKYTKLIFASATFLIISYFSVAATHDYISWNRARWKAINYLLEEKKVSPKIIDGGFEFNGYYNTGSRRAVDDKTSWWFVDKDEYIISFGKITDYSSIKTIPFPCYFLGTSNKIEILKRDSISSKKNPVNFEIRKQVSNE